MITLNEFTSTCDYHCIAPEIALEDDTLVELLRRDSSTQADIDEYLTKNI